MQHRKSRLSLVIAFLFTSSFAYSQVSISPDNTPPESSAMLDIQSTTSGLLVPRMDSTQRQAISIPAEGLLVYDTDLNTFLYYMDTSWINLRSAVILKDTDEDTKIEVDKTLGDNRITFSTAGKELLVMEDSARISVMNSGKSIFLGKDAGRKDDLSDNENVFIGEEAGFSNTEGNKNTFIGYQSGYHNIGSGDGFNSPGNSNTSMGWKAGYTNVEGFDNTLMGFSAGLNNTADRNVFMGAYTGTQNSTGERNTYLGTAAGEFSTTGNKNVAIGMWAGRGISGNGNVFLGYEAGKSSDGDNQLIIQNSVSSQPLIYGKFDNGRVGIGTSNPSEKLEVTGNILSSGTIVSTGEFIQVKDGNQGLSLLANAAEGFVKLDVDGSGHAGDHIVLGEVDGGAPNNVGIGTSSPDSRLQVVGADNNGATATLKVTSGLQSMLLDGNEIDVIDGHLYLQNNSAYDVVLASGGGNVGIATSSPDRELTVFDNDNDGDAIINLKSTNSSAREMIVGVNQSSGGIIGMITNNDLHFRTNNTNHMTIEDGGQIGIGTLTPSDKLHIAAPAGMDALRVQINGTTRLRVHDNGGTSIGSNGSPPASGLYVFGDTEFDGDAFPDNDNVYTLGTATRRWNIVHSANGITQSSDLRLKTNVRPLGYGLPEVMAIASIRYRWKTDPNSNDKIGFSAQNLASILPEVVYKDNQHTDSPLSVNYGEIVPVLVNAIQQQQQMIQSLQDEVRKLKKKID